MVAPSLVEPGWRAETIFKCGTITSECHAGEGVLVLHKIEYLLPPAVLTLSTATIMYIELASHLILLDNLP